MKFEQQIWLTIASFSKQNKNLKYLLVVIDFFSEFLRGRKKKL